jgi:hypothetical protein
MTNTTGGIPANVTISQDIRPGWLNFARRLQSVARRGHHYGIISVKVLVDRSGNPVQWTEPQRTGIEPERSGWLDKLLEDLTKT